MYVHMCFKFTPFDLKKHLANSRKQTYSNAKTYKQLRHRKADSNNIAGGCRIANHCRQQFYTIKNDMSE